MQDQAWTASPHRDRMGYRGIAPNRVSYQISLGAEWRALTAIVQAGLIWSRMAVRSSGSGSGRREMT